MLKKSFTLALAVMLMMTLSCRKEQQVNTLNKKGGNTAALRLAPEELEAVTNDFITQSLSQQWNLGTYEYEDVVLILEGALNYRTCTPHEYYDEIAIDSTATKVNIFKEDDKWLVHPELAIESWNYLLEHANGIKERLQLENCFNIVADLEISGVDYEQEEITVSVVIWAGTNWNIGTPNCNFSNDDFWNAYTFGPCSTGTGSNQFSSWKRVQQKLNPNLPCFGQYECNYFSDISFGYFQPINPLMPCGSGCVNTSDIWSGTSNDCLSPTFLECERDAIRSLSFCYSPFVTGSTVEKKLPISYNVEADPFYTNPFLAFHAVAVKYGKCSTYTPD